MMELRRQFRRLKRDVIFRLPPNLRQQLIRHAVRFDRIEDTAITCQRATSFEDLTRSFQILHHAYVESGFMKPHPSGMRITKYHLLPSTLVLTVKHWDLVIGTVTLIRDSAWGLPVEELCSLDDWRDRKVPLYEISALAIDRTFRYESGIYLFPLLRALYQTLAQLSDNPAVFVSVNPKHWDFYQALFAFRKATDQSFSNYSFVEGAPAEVGFLRLDETYRELQQKYSWYPKQWNLFEYFTQPIDLDPIIRPHEDPLSPTMPPNWVEYFFSECQSIIQNLSRAELEYVTQLYRVLPPTLSDATPCRLFDTHRADAGLPRIATTA